MWEAWSDGAGGRWLWTAGLIGAFLTAIYIFRAVFVVFFGTVNIEPTGQTGYRIAIPLVVLSFLALTAGFVEIPPYLGNVPSFTNLMQSALPTSATVASTVSSSETALIGGRRDVARARRLRRLYRVPAPAGLRRGAGSIAGGAGAAALLGNRLGIRLAV